MKRQILVSEKSGRRTLLLTSLTFTLSGLVACTGCNRLIKRGQSPDDEPSPENILNYSDAATEGPRYISETSRMWGMDYAKVEGIGLAVGLDGTGSPAKPGKYREHLLTELRTRKSEIENPRELAESKNTEMVVCRGYIAPGTRKGDFYDVEVLKVPNADGTSIEDGFVMKTRLRRLVVFNERRLKEGLVVGLIKGPILVDSVFESRQDSANDLNGWILGGGVALENRPIGLQVRTLNFGIKTTTMISRAINTRFTTMTENGREGIAKPTRSSNRVDLLLPDAYRNNVTRFSRVIANIMYGESAQERINRIDFLADEMTNPATCAKAAIRLEAIGKEAIPTLKRSLNNPDLEIRFRAAEALTYCGQPDGLAILKDVAATEPAFRWHALTALSVSQDSDAAQYLEDLMQMESAETRYGAFRSLHIRSPEHPAVYGERFRDFFLHRVPSDVDPMVHFSRSRRPEIVLFGDPKVASNFLFVESGLTIRSNGKNQLKLIHYTGKRGREVTTCSNNVSDLIRELADREFSYGKILKIFREARQADSLDARLVVDAIPGTNRQFSETEEKSDRYVSEPPPELFASAKAADADDDKMTRVSTELINGDREQIEEERSNWEKFKGIFSTNESN